MVCPLVTLQILMRRSLTIQVFLQSWLGEAGQARAWSRTFSPTSWPWSLSTLSPPGCPRPPRLPRPPGHPPGSPARWRRLSRISGRPYSPAGVCSAVVEGRWGPASLTTSLEGRTPGYPGRHTPNLLTSPLLLLCLLPLPPPCPPLQHAPPPHLPLLFTSRRSPSLRWRRSGSPPRRS